MYPKLTFITLSSPSWAHTHSSCSSLLSAGIQTGVELFKQTCGKLDFPRKELLWGILLFTVHHRFRVLVSWSGSLQMLSDLGRGYIYIYIFMVVKYMRYKIGHLNHLITHFSGIKSIVLSNHLYHPSTQLVSCRIETLYPLNNNSLTRSCQSLSNHPCTLCLRRLCCSRYHKQTDS